MGKNKISKVLIIEGSPDTSNGRLAEKFGKLLRKELEQHMPKIYMGKGKFQAIKRFKDERKADFRFLLIDLDRDEEFKEEELANLDLEKYKEWVFFMVQEVEAWFISQPQILDKYYGIDLSKKLKSKHPEKVKNPAKLLQQLTKKTRKREPYHKVKHAVDLLPLLDIQQLRTDFKDFDRLIKKILNPTDK
ncbi:MAG: DUF4276 family protein [Bacteroidota bacterium]